MENKYKIDPTGHFTDHIGNPDQLRFATDNLLEACGFIPEWVMYDKDHDDLNMKDMLETHYPYGMFEIDNSIIDSDGTYHYPEDPDMYPLIKMERGEETLYQYKYGLVAIVQKDGSLFVTRMD